MDPQNNNNPNDNKIDDAAGNNNGTCMEACLTLQHVELFNASFGNVVTNVFSVSILLPSLTSVLFLFHSCCYRYPSDIAGYYSWCVWECLTVSARCIPSIETFPSNETERALVIRSFNDEAVGDAVLAHLRALPGDPSTSWVQALREAMNSVPLPVTDARGSNSSRDPVSPALP
jgi:hypothetical protein